MEALGTILASLRLESAMISRAHLRGRWGVHATGGAGMIVHGIVTGHAVLARDAAPDERVVLEPGDVAILTRGDAHTLVHERGASTVPLRSIATDRARGIPTVDYGASGDEETRIVCGSITLDHPAADGIVSLLPACLSAKAGDGARKRWIVSTLALLDEEPWPSGREPGVRSLVDSVFVHVLGAAAASASSTSSLIAAARDAQIGQALALVHGEPGHAWSVAELGRRVGLSRTRFFDRFSELVGEPPARYIARWRVHAAADLMTRRDLSTAEIAERVGYSSEDALAKVFRRYVGMSPTQWRRMREAGTA
ncbi:MAG: AraC family transcriptional regulator [Labilithrix sp.]|nr:AraC family transcriptional regulator [Labilithrix sp.]